MAARRGWPKTDLGDFEGESKSEHSGSNEGPTGTLVEYTCVFSVECEAQIDLCPFSNVLSLFVVFFFRKSMS